MADAFWERVNGDLDMPVALALTWRMTRSDLSAASKLGLLLEFDRVLGLDLDRVVLDWSIPEDVSQAEKRRSTLRADRDYPAADEVRRQLNEAGFILEDATEATRTRPKSELEKQREELQRVSSSKEVGSLLDAGDETEFSVGIVACNYLSGLAAMRPEPPSPWREALPGGGDSRQRLHRRHIIVAGGAGTSRAAPAGHPHRPRAGRRRR